MSRMWFRIFSMCMFLVLAASFNLACSPEFYQPPAGNTCKTSADCPGSMVCKDGSCVPGSKQEKSDEEGKQEPSDEDIKEEDVSDAADDVPENDGGTDVVVDVPAPECKEGDTRDCYSGPDGTKDKGACKGGKQTCKGGQWGPCDGEVLPKDKETCNGIDDNCDGTVDEKLTRSCFSGDKTKIGTGTCREGVQTCEQGIWGRCVGEVVPETDICDGKDNDCDGDTDEGCKCKDGDKQDCGSDVGECKKGKQTCASGKWGSCVGEVKPSKELCNGKDDNCDGSIDENLTKKCYGGPSGTGGVGDCKEGTQVCNSGQWGACTGEVQPTRESCDNKDNDCDGKVDEDVNRDCYSGPAGTAGVGACKKGREVCSKGVWGSCTGEVKPASKEACDGKDDDCDGTVDEGCTCKDGDTRACGSSTGACQQGKQTCASGNWGACVGEVKPATEVCNGKDDDCDGSTDEGGVCKAELSMATWSIKPGTSRFDTGRIGYGSTVQINFQVKNSGTAKAGGFSVSFYYGSSSSTSGLVKIGSSSISSLDAGKSTASLAVTVSLPTNVVLGTRYIHYFIDSSNSVVESNEGNNRGATNITISGRPNYAPYYFRASNSGSVPAGGSVPVSFQLRNVGASSSTTTFYVGIYYSTDSKITTSDTRLYYARYGGTISAQTLLPSRIATVNVRLPSTATGTVYLGIIVDYTNTVAESNEADNVRAQSFVVQASGSPDLKMASFVFGVKPPTTVGYKTQLSINYNVTNVGKAAAKGSFLYIYYGQTSAQSGLYKIGSVAIPSLDPGKSSGVKAVVVTLPNTVLYGTRYIHFQVDATNLVSESSESNNAGYIPVSVNQYPDFVVTLARANTSLIIPSVAFPIELQLKNIGLGAAVSGARIEIYHSLDSSITSTDKLLWAGTIGNLYADALWPSSGIYKRSVTLSGKVGFPPKSRTEYIGVWINRTGTVKERSTTNNLRVIKISVQR